LFKWCDLTCLIWSSFPRKISICVIINFSLVTSLFTCIWDRNALVFNKFSLKCCFGRAPMIIIFLNNPDFCLILSNKSLSKYGVGQLRATLFNSIYCFKFYLSKSLYINCKLNNLKNYFIKVTACLGACL